MTGNRRRWPPGDKQLPRTDDQPAYFEPMAQAIGDLSKALENLAPSVVIGSAMYQLDALGQAAEQYRAQYSALTVTSGSAFPLIISAGPKGVAAPGPGAGTGLVPPYGHVSVNMKGLAWSLYGGAPGDLVTVQALAKPVLPTAAVGTYAVAKQAFSNLFAGAGQTLTVSGQTAPIQIAPYSTIALQISVLGPVTGTTPSATFTINGVDALGNLYTIGSGTAITAAGNSSLSAGPGTANGAVLPNSVVVSWAITGTTPSFGNTVLTLLGRE